MMQRGSFAITTLILDALDNRRLTRTRIMHELVLTYPRALRYTEQLVKQGLLDYDAETRTFGLTPAGRNVLGLSRQLAEYVSPIQGLVNKYKACHFDGDEVSSVMLPATTA